MRDLRLSSSHPIPVVRQLSNRARDLLAWVEERPGPVLLLILLLALILGIVSLWLHPPDFQFNWENRWWQIAVNVARGEGYVACKTIYFPFCGPSNHVTAMREPLPVLLFAFVALLTHESLLAAAAVGVFINVGIVVAVFLLTRELSDSRAGLLAALLWVCYLPPFRIFYSQPSGDLLATLAITCGVYFFVRARRSDRTSDWLAAGLWLGLATVSRSAALIIVMSLSIGHLVSRRTAEASRSVYPIALFVLAWALIVSPWYVRNYVAFDRPVLGSTLAGYYLYRQNHTLPNDNYLRFVTGGEFVPVLHALIARRPDLSGTENEAEMDQVYREEAQRIIKSEPLRYLAASTYRFLTLWFNWGVPEAYSQHRTLGDYLTILQHVLLLAGAAIGLRRHWRRAWPLMASIVPFSALYMAVMAHVTYIAAAIPLLVALTAIACTTRKADLASSVRS